jgi:hypothetical protein
MKVMQTLQPGIDVLSEVEGSLLLISSVVEKYQIEKYRCFCSGKN